MNNNTNPVEFDVVQNPDVVPEVLPETQEPEITEAPAPKKKSAAARIFGALLAAICVGVLFLPVQVISGTAPTQMTLLNAFMDVFGGKATSSLFGMLPVFADTATVGGTLAGVAFYWLALALVLTLVFGVIALFNGKTCTLRAASFFFAVGFGAYAVCGYALPACQGAAAELDMIMVALAAVGAVLYLVLAFAKVGKKAFASLLQLVLTLAVVAAVVLSLQAYEAEITNAVSSFGLAFDMFTLIVVGVYAVIVVLGALRLATKKGLTLDMIRFIVSLLLAAVICYAAIVSGATTFIIYAAVAVIVSLLQIIICSAQKRALKPKKVKEDPVVEEPVEEPVPEYTVEAYAEALPYEGGPVEGVEIAQEVNPTFEDAKAAIANQTPVNTAGYDFYNSKSFDPFIAILNNEERNQFTEIFILKYKGTMSEIPDYQVGGDNKEFFRKIFIYLGQYRDKIPDGLLAKIYQFAIKMS